jgi:hypothetical protein
VRAAMAASSRAPRISALRGGATSRLPNASMGSSTAYPGPCVAISRTWPSGSRK